MGRGRSFQFGLSGAPLERAIPVNKKQPFCCVGDLPGPGRATLPKSSVAHNSIYFAPSFSNFPVPSVTAQRSPGQRNPDLSHRPEPGGRRPRPAWVGPATRAGSCARAARGCGAGRLGLAALAHGREGRTAAARVRGPTCAPAACAPCASSAARPVSRERGAPLRRLRRGRAEGPGGARRLPGLPDGAIVPAPHLLSILEKFEECVTGSVRGTKGRVSAGHAEVAPRQTTRAAAPAKRLSRARGTLQGFSF